MTTPTLPLEPQTGREHRIVMRWDVGKTSENQLRQKSHWGGRADVNKKARKHARDCWEAAGAWQARGKVRLSVIVRRGRTMDVANVWGSLKALIDGVFCNGVTPDDSAKWLELGSVTQETGARWKGREEVEFLISEVVI